MIGNDQMVSDYLSNYHACWKSEGWLCEKCTEEDRQPRELCENQSGSGKSKRIPGEKYWNANDINDESTTKYVYKIANYVIVNVERDDVDEDLIDSIE